MLDNMQDRQLTVRLRFQLQRTLQRIDGPPSQIACHKHVPDVCHDRRFVPSVNLLNDVAIKATKLRDQFDVGQTCAEPKRSQV